jgi:hypothetical protein
MKEKRPAWHYEFVIKVQTDPPLQWWSPWRYTTGPEGRSQMYGSTEQRDVWGLVVRPFIIEFIRWRFI